MDLCCNSKYPSKLYDFVIIVGMLKPTIMKRSVKYRELLSLVVPLNFSLYLSVSKHLKGQKEEFERKSE